MQTGVRPQAIVAHVVRDRQAEIGAVNRDVAVPLVDVADVLQRGDDRELGVLQCPSPGPGSRRGGCPGTSAARHSCRPLAVFRPPDDACHMGAVRAAGDGTGSDSVISFSTTSQLVGRSFFASAAMSFQALANLGARAELRPASRSSRRCPPMSRLSLLTISRTCEKSNVFRTRQTDPCRRAAHEGRMRAVDAGVEHRPDDLVAFDVEQCARGVRLYGTVPICRVPAMPGGSVRSGRSHLPGASESPSSGLPASFPAALSSTAIL